MDETLPTEYVPGQCNIGRAETRARRIFGWISAGVAVLLWGALRGFHAPRFWQLTLFLPASGAASGFLQAHFHFCTGFAARSLANFGELGHPVKVTSQAAHQADRRRARQINGLSALTGLIVALAGVLLG